jgi:hypothetical protein
VNWALGLGSEEREKQIQFECCLSFGRLAGCEKNP